MVQIKADGSLGYTTYVGGSADHPASAIAVDTTGPFMSPASLRLLISRPVRVRRKPLRAVAAPAPQEMEAVHAQMVLFLSLIALGDQLFHLSRRDK